MEINLEREIELMKKEQQGKPPLTEEQKKEMFEIVEDFHIGLINFLRNRNGEPLLPTNNTWEKHIEKFRLPKENKE